jgi:pimeloyl-ACP methyl ester carboxylesterase
MDQGSLPGLLLGRDNCSLLRPISCLARRVAGFGLTIWFAKKIASEHLGAVCRMGRMGLGWEGISARKIYRFIGPGPIEEGWEKKFKEKGLDAIPKEAIQVWEGEKHSGHISSLISSYRYTSVYDSHDTYASIAKSDIATLTLLGENDGFFEVEYMKKELESLAWRGKVQVVKGAGHGVIAEKTKEMMDSMLAFWNEL